jgi:hypothetical protein
MKLESRVRNFFKKLFEAAEASAISLSVPFFRSSLRFPKSLISLRNIESSSQFNEFDNFDESDIEETSRTPIRRSKKDTGKKIAAILEIHSFEGDVKTSSISRRERR